MIRGRVLSPATSRENVLRAGVVEDRESGLDEAATG